VPRGQKPSRYGFIPLKILYVISYKNKMQKLKIINLIVNIMSLITSMAVLTKLLGWW